MLGIIVDKNFHESRKWVVFSTYDLIEGLRTSTPSIIISNQEEYNRVKEQLTACFSTFPSWSVPKIKHDTSLNYIKGISLSDPHHKDPHNWFPNYIEDNEFDFIFPYYYHPTLYHYPHFKDKIIHTTWAIPDRFLGKEVKFHNNSFIQIFGSVNSDAYTTRKWCHQFPFVEVDANSGCENPSLSEDEYYSWLGNFDAIIGAGSLSNKYQLVTPKYYEIANSGALLFAQKCKDLELNGFNKTNCVIFDEDDFLDKANLYLKNKEDYLEIRKRGQELIKKRHTISKRVKQILDALGTNRKVFSLDNFSNNQNLNALMFLNEESENTIEKELIKNHYIEDNISSFLLDFLNKDKICLDIGSNIGYYSILFSKLSKYVISIEKDKKNFSILKKNIKINDIKNIDLYQYQIKSDKQEDYYSLDSLFNCCIDIIKINPSNNNLNIIKGANKLISKYSPLIIFKTPKVRSKKESYEIIELWNYFKEKKYNLFLDAEIDNKVSSIETFINIANQKNSPLNFLAKK